MQNNLKEIRKSKDIVLWHLATIARVNPSVLSAIERYNYQPTTAICDRIAKALNVTVSDIWPENLENGGKETNDTTRII